MKTMTYLTVLSAAVALLATTPVHADEDQVRPGGGGDLFPPVDENEIPVNEMSREECLDIGGNPVGDIGNGAIFRADYVCENNGLPPIAVIVLAGEDLMMAAVDGEVCCGSDDIVTIISLPEGEEAVETTDGEVDESLGDGDSLPGFPPDDKADRPDVTREGCVESGGVVVGDIGDGAIFREDYVCSTSGEAPTANVAQPPAEEGQPIAIEGEVCCKAAVVVESAPEASLQGEDDSASTNVVVALSSLIYAVTFVAMAIAL